MLRWVMVFETRNSREYVNQLAGLVPHDSPSRPDAMANTSSSRNPLNVPCALEAKDVASLNRIYWVDDKPQSVRGVLQELGVTMSAPHFVAFMPRQLEAELSEKELKFAKGRGEEDIFETKFKVVHGVRGYDVIVTNQTFR